MSLIPDPIKESLRKRATVPYVAAGCFLLVTLATAGHYGFYGDELYYYACSRHLDWGYVDHPPLVALLTLVDTWIFGETVIGLRVLSGLAGALTVLLSAELARFFGGGKPAQTLAALSICFASAFPALSSFFSMNPVDVMLCTLFVYLFARTIASPSPQKWITLGILFGTGLLNKYTFLVLGLSLLLSLIITRRWDVLSSVWMYAGGVIALVMFLPHLTWQVHHGWPTIEFMHNATEYKNLSLSPVAFLSQLAISLNPFTLPLWLSGLLYLLLSKESKEHRFLGGMAVIFVLVYLFQNSKTYYVLPVFPLLLSAGVVAIEKFSLSHRIRWPARVIGSTMIAAGTLLMPLAVPVLPVTQLVSYAKTLGLWNLIRLEKGEGDRLPIHFVYRMGWEELVDSVETAYGALPRYDREKCAILASWYGIAGAVDHFGPGHGLPNAICPRNSYWMWGTREYSGEEVLAVGYDSRFLEQFFDSVKPVAYFRNPYAYDAEIYLCKKPKASLDQMWPRLKKFI